MLVKYSGLVTQKFDPNFSSVFLHLPKTGGSSMSDMLNSIYHDEYRRINPDALARSVISNHGKIMYKAVLEHYALSDAFYNDISGPFNHVTVLREPVDRVISQYYFLRRETSHHLHRLAREHTLGEICGSDLIYTMGMSNVQTRRLVGSLISMNPRVALLHAKENLREAFTFFGLFDKLDEFLAVCKFGLDWPDDVTLPHVNVSNRPTHEEISPEIKQMILEKNRSDQLLYSYAEEVYARRIDGLLLEIEEKDRVELPVTVRDFSPEEDLTEDQEVPEMEVVEEATKGRFRRLWDWILRLLNKKIF
jgi:hypothetical protein